MDAAESIAATFNLCNLRHCDVDNGYTVAKLEQLAIPDLHLRAHTLSPLHLQVCWHFDFTWR